MTKLGPPRECAICHETKPHKGRGMCNACYAYWLKHRGSPDRRDHASPDVWEAGWVRDGLILRPAVNIREWSA